MQTNFYAKTSLRFRVKVTVIIEFTPSFNKAFSVRKLFYSNLPSPLQTNQIDPS